MAPAFVSAGKPQEGKYEEERKEEDSGWKEKGFYTLCGRAGEREGLGKQAAKVVSGRILKKKKEAEGVRRRRRRKGWDWIVWDALLTYSHVPKSAMYIQYGVRGYIRRYGHVLTDRVTTSTYIGIHISHCLFFRSVAVVWDELLSFPAPSSSTPATPAPKVITFTT